MPCYLDTIPSTSMTTTRRVPHRTSVPFTSCLYPTTSLNKVGLMSNVPYNPVWSSWTKRRHPTLLDQLQQQKHPQLMAGWGTADDAQPPLMCFCNDPLALRVSRTAKNPGRLFLGCKSQKCTFFQWTDEPWSQALRDRWAQVLRHLGP